MKLRTVCLLWVAAIVLGIAAYTVKFHGNQQSMPQTELTPGERIMPALPIRELSSVTLQQGQELCTLVRDTDNTWRIKERDNYPANHELLRNLLGTLHSMKVTQSFACQSSQFGRFGLANNSQTPSDLGLRVTMSNASGKTLAEVWLGKFSGASRNSTGRYIRITGDHSGVYSVGQTFPGVYADAPSWFDPSFLAIRRVQSVKVSSPENPDFQSWELLRKGVEAKHQFSMSGLAADETMQLTSTTPYANLFAYTSFQDVFTPDQVKPLENPDPKQKRTAVIRTFDGLSYIINYWPEKEKPITPQDPDSPLPPVRPGYLMTVEIEGEIAEQRTPDPSESSEQAQQNDQAFAMQQSHAQQQWDWVKSLEGRVFKVGHTLMDPLERQRQDFVVQLPKSGNKNPTPASNPRADKAP